MPEANPGATRHLIVTRFSVPRRDQATAARHRDREWLAGHIALLRRYYVPSVARLGAPAVLLCSGDSAPWVAEQLADLDWVRIEVQDDWYGGWTGSKDQVLTRLDSDDAVHEGWLAAVDAAPRGYEVYATKRFLRYDPAGRRLYDRARDECAPLAAFAGGRNPYARDHATLERHYRTCVLPGPYLLQVVHGGNLSWRQPRWWHFRYKVPLARLEPFSVEP